MFRRGELLLWRCTSYTISQFTFDSNSVVSNEPMVNKKPADVPSEISFDSGNQLYPLDNRELLRNL